MIDDYKYMYLYKPLYIYMDVYIKDCIDIWDFSLVGVVGCIRILALG